MNKITVFLASFLMFMCSLVSLGYADSSNMVWQTPYGTIGLPFSATEALAGYDGILKQSVYGVSLPVYQDPKSIITASVGAVAPIPTTGPAIEPYVGVGHDILKEIPYLDTFSSAHLNIFGRYAATKGGKFGAGLSFSYAFVGGWL